MPATACERKGPAAAQHGGGADARPGEQHQRPGPNVIHPGAAAHPLDSLSLLGHSCRLRTVPDLHAALPILTLSSGQQDMLKSVPGICIRQQACEYW